MVKKLFKHEMYAYLRTILPMHMFLIGIALLGRIVQLFDNNSNGYSIVFWSSVVAFIIGIITCVLLTFVFCIRRFYVNLFTYEGYLTLTLPVTSSQHIFVKNVVALISQITSFIMIIIATCVITFGDVCVELFKAAAYLLKYLYVNTDYHATFFIVEFILALIAVIMTTYMLFYACIALGQRAKKNRVASSVGIFFLYYLIIQVIMTTIIVLANEFWKEWKLDVLFEYLSDHPIFTTHLFFGVIIAVSAVMYLVYYLITNKTIKNKLNLE